MGKAPNHKSPRKYRPKEVRVICNKQFPDCPPEPNDANCGACPLYKK